MRCNVFFFFLLLLLTSCTNGGKRLVIDVHETDYVNKTDVTLDGTALDIIVDGVQEILFCDSFLVALTSDPERIFKVYNPENKCLVASFGTIGRAKNEFSRDCFTLEKTNYNRDGVFYIPIVDKGNLIKELDLTNSIRENQVVISNVCENPIFGWGYGSVGLVDNSFDTLFYSTEVEHHPVRINKCKAPKFFKYSVENQKKEEIKVYSRIMKIKKEDYYKTLYYIRTFKHPQKNIFVCPFFCRDYMFFFDLDNNKQFAIHQEGTETFESKLSENQLKEMQNGHCFPSVEPTEDFVIAMYLGGDYSKGFESDHQRPEILLFDWNGNYITGAKINNEIHSICYDKNNAVLYGVNYDEEIIYKYELSPLIDKYL